VSVWDSPDKTVAAAIAQAAQGMKMGDRIALFGFRMSPGKKPGRVNAAADSVEKL
jgi:hypothetical protein